MSTSNPQLIDLRTHPDPALLTAFVELYMRTFTEPTEREDPAQWPPRLYGGLPPPEPQMHLLVAVAGDAAQRALLGGIAFEYYRHSRCGLLTYLAIDPDHRRRGLARRLVQQAIALLQADAAAAGVTLRGAFSEVEDPAQVDVQGNAMAPHERVAALARLGARRIDIPYVQPTLEGASGRCRHLWLLAFHPDAAQATHIGGGVVHDFLHEFYRALGVGRPEADAEFLAMERHLRGTLTLHALEYVRE